MKNLIIIVNIIKNLIIHPIKTAGSKELVQYDMRTMNYFIVLISIIYYNFFYFLSTNEFDIIILILSCIVRPIFVLLIIQGAVIFYKYFLESAVDFVIPFNNIKKVILPYIATTQLFTPIILRLLNDENVQVTVLLYLLLIAWFNLQIFYVSIYRLKNKPMNVDERKKIAIKLIVLGLVSFGLVTGASITKWEHGKEKNNLLIRKEICVVYKEVFDETKLIMESGGDITDDIFNCLDDKMYSIFVDKKLLLTENEVELQSYIYKMIRANRAWYEAKLRNDMAGVKEQQKEYNTAEKAAEYLFNNFLEGSINT